MSGSGRRPGRPPRGPRGRAPADPARLAAYQVLAAVRVDDAYANLVLPHVLGQLGLSGRDAAFATELASGTLRGRGTYDAVLAACVDRPLAKVEAKVLDLLRLGAHQLLAMRVPAHAALNTTVDLVRSKVGPGAAGFANAVLRKVSAKTLEEWVAVVAPSREDDPAGWAAVAYSHPRWVVEELTTAVGASEIADLLAADNEPPRVTLVARPGRATREELLAESGSTPTRFSPYGVTLAGGSPAGVAAVAEGRAGVQDEGSQLVAIALVAAPLEGRDELWLDLCAGPGGKSALMAALAAERGARLVGNERQPHRARLVRAGLVRASLVARGLGTEPNEYSFGSRTPSDAAPADGALTNGALGVVAGDGTQPPFRAGTFDRILVDAPCTGLGALRRRPEARWRRQPRDVEELVALQRRLVESALDLVRPGGLVLYATCSPVLAETAEVVKAVLASRPDAAVLDAALDGVRNAPGPLPGTLQLWPHRHGTDAMFLALLRRR